MQNACILHILQSLCMLRTVACVCAESRDCASRYSATAHHVPHIARNHHTGRGQAAVCGPFVRYNVPAAAAQAVAGDAVIADMVNRLPWWQRDEGSARLCASSCYGIARFDS